VQSDINGLLIPPKTLSKTSTTFAGNEVAAARRHRRAEGHAMSKNQDVMDCFTQAFEKNQPGNAPVMTAKISAYNMPVPQVLLILSMTRDCLATKGWHYPVPSSVDTSETWQLLVTSIMNSTNAIPVEAGFALRRPAAKAKKPAKPKKPAKAKAGKAKAAKKAQG
jgi:hypothetical protein